MPILEELKAKPSRFKIELKKYGVPVSYGAPHLGVSYSHLVNMLNGVFKIPQAVEMKLQQLVDQLAVQESTKK